MHSQLLRGRLAGLLFLMLAPGAVAAQEATRLDTLAVPAGTVIGIADSVLVATRDTVLVLPDTVVYRLLEERQRVEAFYDTLQTRANRGWLSRALYDLLFVSEAAQDPAPTAFVEGAAVYAAYEGKPIRSIRVKRLEVFGPTVHDTAATAETWLPQALNHVHVRTAAAVVRDNLFIAVGESVYPALLAANARTLRQLPYLEDARILVAPSPQSSDSVDVVVVTKDVWSLGLKLRFFDESTARATVYDGNFLGTGSRAEVSTLMNPTRNPAFGLAALYRIENVRGSFITLQGAYANTFERRLAQVRGDRRLLFPTMRFVGGAEASRRDTLRAGRWEGYDRQGLWAGRVLAARAGGAWRNLVFSVKGARRHYHTRPEVGAGTNQSYHHYELLLGSVTLVQQRYYQSSLVFGFGRTEDLPVGYKATLTGGWAWGEYVDRPYLGVELVRAASTPVGYVLGQGGLGGFLRQGRFEQGVLRLEGLLVSPLLRVARYGLRQFLVVDFTKGLRRFPEEVLHLEGGNAVRGLDGEDLRGDERLVVRLETVLFTPWDAYGFRVAAFGFGDVGWLAADGPLLRTEHVRPTLGLGCRIQNERLLFDAFQVRLAWSLRNPEGASPLDAVFSTPPRFGLTVFEQLEPRVLPFQ